MEVLLDPAAGARRIERPDRLCHPVRDLPVPVAVFGVHISSLPGFAGDALCFALVTASFGVLVAAFSRTPEVARKMAMFATLLMVMVGGARVPSFMFPAWLQQASLAMPTRWAVEGFDAITWRGMDVNAVWRFRKMEG
jgi:ABC-2 type transport system permease protein